MRTRMFVFSLVFIAACKPSESGLPTSGTTLASPEILTVGSFTHPSDFTGQGDGGSIPEPDRGAGHDHGVIQNLLFCGETGQIVLGKGQETALSWSYEHGTVPSTPLQLILQSDPPGIANVGSVTMLDALHAVYRAPASVPVEFTLNILANEGNSSTPAVCHIRLLKDGGLGVEDDGQTRGAVGNVYVLPVNTPRIPDFALMTPILDIVSPNLDYPTRSFSDGFPGVPDLFEWFGIRFQGRLVLPEAGTYQFRLTADDGSNFYLDNAIVINNDGVHAPVTKDASLTKNAGTYPFRVDYFQGPRYLIALQLMWKKPSDSGFVVIPPDNFLRPQ